MYFKPVKLPNLDVVKQQVSKLITESTDPEFQSMKYQTFLVMPLDFYKSIVPLVQAVETVRPWSDVNYIAIVRTTPGIMDIHVDNDVGVIDQQGQYIPGPPEQKWALNIPITNCEETYTCWYKLKPGRQAKRVLHPINNYFHNMYDLEDLDEVGRYYLHSAGFFNALEIHRPVNNTNQDRVVLSVRFNTDLKDVGIVY
jgi:hypothetical protein